MRTTSGFKRTSIDKSILVRYDASDEGYEEGKDSEVTLYARSVHSEDDRGIILSQVACYYIEDFNAEHTCDLSFTVYFRDCGETGDRLIRIAKSKVYEISGAKGDMDFENYIEKLIII